MITDYQMSSHANHASNAHDSILKVQTAKSGLPQFHKSHIYIELKSQVARQDNFTFSAKKKAKAYFIVTL